MDLCIRIDLDYVPWDTPDALEFGHGEPAMLLRLLELAKTTGVKYHFFASNRSLRAFPAEAEAVLNDGHDLDWLCKRPEAVAQRYAEAHALFDSLGHHVVGAAVKAPWPPEAALPPDHELRFLSGPLGATPANISLFPVETRPEREAVRAGQSAKEWLEGVKTHLRQCACVGRAATVVLRPQVLAKVDPKLATTKELASFAQAIGMNIRTLRDLIDRP